MNLFSLFNNSCEKFPENSALFVDDSSYTYKELQSFSAKITAILKQLSGVQVAILSNRTLTAYAAILASLQSGKTYVPLNTKAPVLRNKRILKSSFAKILIIDDKSVLVAGKILDRTGNQVLIFPETPGKNIPLYLKNSFIVYTKEDLEQLDLRVENLSGEENAYIIFTSGSTGDPKGVPVSHRNVLAYIKTILEKYEFSENDRFSQTADISFDLSKHEIFLAWAVGATLFCIPGDTLMAPANFIRKNAITIWTSVPSIANIMYKYKMLRPGCFPSLRYSFFCGEPLLASIAASWQKAASNGDVVNIYGPTETTVGISIYSLPKNPERIRHLNNIVAIGEIFSNHQWCLVDEENFFSEEEGELCISGPQVTNGYWMNENLNLQKYTTLESSKKMWYKTGDIVRRNNGILYFISRKDFQVKIKGYRVELEEINFFISQFVGGGEVFTLPFPVQSGVAEGLYTFISNSPRFHKKEILDYLSSNLPDYMVPKNIFYLNPFPLNQNGKVDKNQLIHILKQHK